MDWGFLIAIVFDKYWICPCNNVVQLRNFKITLVRNVNFSDCVSYESVYIFIIYHEILDIYIYYKAKQVFSRWNKNNIEDLKRFMIFLKCSICRFFFERSEKCFSLKHWMSNNLICEFKIHFLLKVESVETYIYVL